MQRLPTPPARFLLGSLCALVLLAAGCAQEVGDIDRTQAGLLQKAVFTGDWFMRRTVVDAPYDTTWTFIGEQEDTQRIRWDIQEHQLIAWRVVPQVEGTQDAAPIAVYAIKEHVDVQRRYNDATGEQANVVEENTTDRMWYEREYLRVDWSKNLVSGFQFVIDGLETQPVDHTIMDPGDPDRLLVGVRGEDGVWTDITDDTTIRDLGAAQYIDFVSKVAVKPDMIAFDDGFGGIIWDPACWYYMNEDCAPGVIAVRTAFLRADAALSDYDPLPYPDNAVARDDDGKSIRVRWTKKGDRVRVDAKATGPAQPGGGQDTTPANPYEGTDTSVVRVPFFDKFGYFRTERMGYDPLYGEVESARTYLIQRWNIWEKSHDADGEPLPYAKRTVRPIIYYLSPGFPAALLPAANKVVDQWNDALVATLKSLGVKKPPRAFELRENSRAVDPDTGVVTKRGEIIGDLRYSHLYLVEQPTRAGLLGYGPSAVDPITGEIFAADAFVYGATVKELAARGRDIVDLINGRLDPADLALGENVAAHLLAGGKPVTAPSKSALVEFARTHQGAGPAQQPGAATKTGSLPKRPAAAGAPGSAGTNGTKGPKGIERLRRPKGWSDARASVAHGTALEALLGADPAVGATSPLSRSTTVHRKRLRDRMMKFANRNMMMAEFVDDAVAGLATSLKDTPTEEVLATLEAAIFRSTSEHEVGHTIGLRHNFEASTDALNYHDHYWDLRGDNPKPMAELTAKEKKGRLRELQYSSIMDYAGRFNTDIAGLGPYDRAAIKFGYGQLVEVFEAPPKDALLDVVVYDDGSADRPFQLDDVLRGLRHYTKIPSMFGGLQNMRKRRDVPYTTLAARLAGKTDKDAYVSQLTGDAGWKNVEAPYRFCSDEYVDGTATCHMFDTGADGWEMVADVVERWRNYYWFNNFRRDQVMFDEWTYMDTMLYRYFGLVQNVYQGWVFDQWFKADTWEWLRYDAAKFGIEDAPWMEASDAGLVGTAAAREGLSFLFEVLATPEPGAYMVDYFEGYAWPMQTDPLPVCNGTTSWESEDWCADSNVPLGTGRWLYSVYDVDTGYTFYERLKWIGTFYDKLLALETLTSPNSYFLGVDTFQSVDEWAISMYLAFPDELQRLFAGMAADRFDLFAGTFDKRGEWEAPDPFRTEPTPWPEETLGAPVDPQTSFTIQLYTLWYGMAWLNANFDNTFNDGAKIWLDGSGEAIAVADPDRLVTLANPFNGRTYVALRTERAESPGVGETMLDEAQYWLDTYELWKEDPEVSEADVDYVKWKVTNLVENIEVVRGLHDMYGMLIF